MHPRKIEKNMKSITIKPHKNNENKIGNYYHHK